MLQKRSSWLGYGFLTVGNIVLLLLVYFGLTAPFGPQTASTAPGDIMPTSIADMSSVGPTPTPIPLVNIVIAVQNIPRGVVIGPSMVDLWSWPAEAAPFSGITSIEDVVGKIARTDIFREEPILTNRVVDSLGDLAEVGSDVAAMLPEGWVAKTVWLPRTTLSGGIQVGDRVNVYATYTENSAAGTTATTELIVDAARVLWIGEFPADGRFLDSPATPTPDPSYDDPISRPVPTPGLTRPSLAPDEKIPLTLIVTNQDAASLIWSEHNQVPLSLVIRSAVDMSRAVVNPIRRNTRDLEP